MSIAKTSWLWLVIACGAQATACDDSSARQEEVDQLLAGDGHEFESNSSGGLDLIGSSSSALVRSDQVIGTACCTDGDCVCRGEAPTDRTLDRNGPYSVSSYSRGFRNGRDFGGATVYYPTNAPAPLSGVVMCPGYTAVQSSIADWGPFFASHGIVLVTIDTNTTLDQVPQRAEALLDALASLRAENTRTGSPLYGKLSTNRFGLAGWSMGGGGTWIATSDHPELRSAVTLAGHNLTAGGGAVAAGSRVPTLMLNGALDTTILGGLGQSEAAYERIPSTTPKLLYVMSNAGHFSWGTPRTNNNAAGRYVMAWEKVFLEGDQRYRPFLLQRGPAAATWRTNLR